MIDYVFGTLLILVIGPLATILLIIWIGLIQMLLGYESIIEKWFDK